MNVISIKKGMRLCAFLLVGLMCNQAQSAENPVEPDQVTPLAHGIFLLGPNVNVENEASNPASEDWLGPIVNEITHSDKLDSLGSKLVITPPYSKATQSTLEGVNTDAPSIVEPRHNRHPLPRIAILIDDLGYNRQGMESALALPKNVALAILPLTPFAHKTATQAKKQHRVTLLHAPMENVRELKLGPGGLYAKMTEEQLKKALIKDIDSLPGIKGVNNHMGSLLTAKQDSMDWVMEVLKKRSLFFIDSLTSSHSVAKETAQKHGLKTTSRDIFLDNIRTEKAIDRQFSRLVKEAKHSGVALAIGHPYPETMAYLKKRLVKLEKEGVRLVPLTTVLHNSPIQQ
ncbi:divergent polysaccharide deacetylase family protein [Marinomonas flavescens]|uniref:divergent polysaccharide deacetylase family protein n=1 Tax=Marinomonas flavescens TaxID=2529379 RepID=UPI001F0B18E5|nr:divergent polysaccharide deacetylase family protein [Marinomonas flavescens]